MRVAMVRNRRGMLRRRRHLTLPRHHHGKPIDNGHHHALVRTPPPFRRVPPPTLFIGHRLREYRSSIERWSRIHLILCCPGSRGVAFRTFQQSHHVRFQSVRFTDGRRLGFVLVRLGVRMMALDRHGVTHSWWNYVGQTLDCVGSIHFVTGNARDFVHSDLFAISRPLVLAPTYHFTTFSYEPKFLENTAILTSCWFYKHSISQNPPRFAYVCLLYFTMLKVGPIEENYSIKSLLTTFRYTNWL